MTSSNNEDDASMQPAENDPVLSFLVSLVEANPELPEGMPITLLTQGFLVSGHIITFLEYANSANLERLAEETAKAGDQNSVNPFGRRHIHLKNAKFFSGAGHPVPTSGGTFWRGRLSEISGFFHGVLAVN